MQFQQELQIPPPPPLPLAKLVSFSGPSHAGRVPLSHFLLEKGPLSELLLEA